MRGISAWDSRLLTSSGTGQVALLTAANLLGRMSSSVAVSIPDVRTHTRAGGGARGYIEHNRAHAGEIGERDEVRRGGVVGVAATTRHLPPPVPRP